MLSGVDLLRRSSCSLIASDEWSLTHSLGLYSSMLEMCSNNFMSKTCDIENQKEDENHLEEIKKDNIEAARKQRSKFKATTTEEANSDQK
jgi:hypothetical protein